LFFWCFHCSQARGAKKEAEASKDDVIEALESLITDMFAKLGDNANDPQFNAVVQRLRHVVVHCRDNKDSLKTLFGALPREALLKIQNTMDSTNCELKLTSIRSCLFRDEGELLKKRESAVALARDLMKEVARYLCTNAFGSETGDINWRGGVKSELENIKQNLDKQAGIREAMAAAAAAAAAAAPAARAAADAAMAD
jgi:hypothetical protein